MNTFKTKIALAAICLLAIANFAKAQGTLEMTTQGNLTAGVGPSVTPVTVNFWQDATNPVTPTTFRPASPALSVTASFANQQFNTVYSNISTGMAFGGGNQDQNVGAVQASASNNIFDLLGGALPQAPQNGMFMSSPSAAPLALGNATGGRGLDVEASTGAQYNYGNFPIPTTGADANTGLAVFTNVEPLFDANADKAGRFYYGDLVFTFSRPVVNPVIHVGGLGGSYTFQPSVGSPFQISYFTTELELQNTATSVRMSGNEFFNIPAGTNNILNSSATPNGGSYPGGFLNGFALYGAATGSVKVVGTFTQLVYKVYVRGSASSQFNFSKNKEDFIPQAQHDPLNGDLFYIGVSLDKPTQQISGNVYNDADGLKDAPTGDINRTAGVKNPGVNVAGSLKANLLLAGVVVATVPVNADGSYLFDGVGIGAYTVNISTTAGSATASTPTGWVNTGEFIGAGPGNDGAVNGTSAPIVIVLGTIVNEVNFGIERVPESYDHETIITKPAIFSSLILNNPMPILDGNDPEDMSTPVPSVLTNKSVQITTLPTNSTLRYNGSNVIAGQIITNFDPSLLSFYFNMAIPTQTTQFFYSYVDRAGVPDPTPAFYRVRWTAGGPLAVTLSDLTAYNKECSAIVSWKATTELNVDKYEVEVTTKNDFTKAGEVIALNSGTAQNYSFTYPMQSGVVYYFRLKVINLDGTFSYSNSVVKASCAGKIQITVAPNPVRDAFRITGMGAGKNTIAIYANDGKLVRSETAANSTKEINISSFLRGMYVVKIISENGEEFTQKIIKE